MHDTSASALADDAGDLLTGHLYKLDGKKPVPCSVEEYLTFMQSAANRIIEQTHVGPWLVSTIFTGIDHNFGQGDKRLFETQIFNLPGDAQPRWRYATWKQAVRQHRQLVVLLESQGAEPLLRDMGLPENTSSAPAGQTDHRLNTQTDSPEHAGSKR